MATFVRSDGRARCRSPVSIATDAMCPGNGRGTCVWTFVDTGGWALLAKWTRAIRRSPPRIKRTNDIYKKAFRFWIIRREKIETKVPRPRRRARWLRYGGTKTIVHRRDERRMTSRGRFWKKNFISRESVVIFSRPATFACIGVVVRFLRSVFTRTIRNKLSV